MRPDFASWEELPGPEKGRLTVADEAANESEIRIDRSIRSKAIFILIKCAIISSNMIGESLYLYLIGMRPLDRLRMTSSDRLS